MRRIHEGHENYKCSECGKSFLQERKFSEHIARCHKSVKRESENNLDHTKKKFVEQEKKSISISKITNPKSHNPKIVSTILNKIVKIKIVDFSICNCKNKGKSVSSHYCHDCNEGFCDFCNDAHQRFKVTRMHKIIKINYFCKCKSEENFLAAKYCTECSEFFCASCIDAHQRLIVTRNHILKSI